MSNLYTFPNSSQPSGYNGSSDGDILSIKGSGGGGGGNDMFEKRLGKLEEDVSSLKTDLAIIKANYSTKEDIASVRIEVHQSISAQTKWIAATIIGTTALALGIAKYLFS